jgi:alanine dehydrogenase
MVIGVPKEIKDHETRVGLVPSAVTALREAGHEVLVQTHAGEGSTLSDDEYTLAGATIVPFASDVWSRADLIVKVKEPQPSEYVFFRPDLILFTYLHLAPLPDLTDQLLQSRVSGVAYETSSSLMDLCPCSLP